METLTSQQPSADQAFLPNGSIQKGQADSLCLEDRGEQDISLDVNEDVSKQNVHKKPENFSQKDSACGSTMNGDDSLRLESLLDSPQDQPNLQSKEPKLEVITSHENSNSHHQSSVPTTSSDYDRDREANVTPGVIETMAPKKLSPVAENAMPSPSTSLSPSAMSNEERCGLPPPSPQPNQSPSSPLQSPPSTDVTPSSSLTSNVQTPSLPSINLQPSSPPSINSPPRLSNSNPLINNPSPHSPPSNEQTSNNPPPLSPPSNNPPSPPSNINPPSNNPPPPSPPSINNPSSPAPSTNEPSQSPPTSVQGDEGCHISVDSEKDIKENTLTCTSAQSEKIKDPLWTTNKGELNGNYIDKEVSDAKDTEPDVDSSMKEEVSVTISEVEERQDDDCMDLLISEPHTIESLNPEDEANLLRDDNQASDKKGSIHDKRDSPLQEHNLDEQSDDQREKAASQIDHSDGLSSPTVTQPLTEASVDKDKSKPALLNPSEDDVNTDKDSLNLGLTQPLTDAPICKNSSTPGSTQPLSDAAIDKDSSNLGLTQPLTDAPIDKNSSGPGSTRQWTDASIDKDNSTPFITKRLTESPTDKNSSTKPEATLDKNSTPEPSPTDKGTESIDEQNMTEATSPPEERKCHVVTDNVAKVPDSVQSKESPTDKQCDESQCKIQIANVFSDDKQNVSNDNAKADSCQSDSVKDMKSVTGCDGKQKENSSDGLVSDDCMELSCTDQTSVKMADGDKALSCQSSDDVKVKADNNKSNQRELNSEHCGSKEPSQDILDFEVMDCEASPDLSEKADLRLGGKVEGAILNEKDDKCDVIIGDKKEQLDSKLPNEKKESDIGDMDDIIVIEDECSSNDNDVANNKMNFKDILRVPQEINAQKNESLKSEDSAKERQGLKSGSESGSSVDKVGVSISSKSVNCAGSTQGEIKKDCKRALPEDFEENEGSPKRLRGEAGSDKKADGDKTLGSAEGSGDIVECEDDVIIGSVVTKPAVSLQVSSQTLQTYVTACVKGFLRKRKQDYLERLDKHARTIEAAGTLWAETAKHLQKSVEDLATQRQKLESKRAQVSAKVLAANSVGTQVGDGLPNFQAAVKSPPVLAQSSMSPSARLTLPPSQRLNQQYQQNRPTPQPAVQTPPNPRMGHQPGLRGHQQGNMRHLPQTRPLTSNAMAPRASPYSSGPPLTSPLRQAAPQRHLPNLPQFTQDRKPEGLIDLTDDDDAGSKAKPNHPSNGKTGPSQVHTNGYLKPGVVRGGEPQSKPRVSNPPGNFAGAPNRGAAARGGLQTTTALPSKPVTHSLPPSVHINKHPASLPPAPKHTEVPHNAKRCPPKPSLKISRVAQGIVLSWNMPSLEGVECISSYQLFAYQETDSAIPCSSLWKKVGDVKALPLPMACTLTQFHEGNKYHFAVRAMDRFGRCGMFSDASTIFLGPK